MQTSQNMHLTLMQLTIGYRGQMETLNGNKEELGNGNSPVPPVEQSTENNDGWNPDTNKPYMRQLGKQYWGDERLTKFDSLNGLVDAYFESTKPKAPEKYSDGITDEMSEVFRGIDLSDESAKKVAEFIESSKPKKVDVEKVLRERHSEDYDAFMARANKAVEAYSDESLKALSEQYDLSSNPAFMEFMSRIGKDVGDDYHNFHKDKGSKEAPKDFFMELAKKSTGAK